MDTPPPSIRPSFDDCRTTVTRMARERAPYPELADFIDAAGLTPGQIAELWLLAWAQSEAEDRIERAVAMARRRPSPLSVVRDPDPG